MVLSWIMYCIVGASGGYLFGVADGYGKDDVVSRPTHLYSPKVDFCIDGGNFVSHQSTDYSSMSRSNKDRSYYSLSHKRNDQFIADGDGRVGVGVGLRTTHLYS